MLDTARLPSSKGQWPEACPWLMLLRAARIAIGTPLLLATLGALATAAGWNLSGRLFLNEATELRSGNEKLVAALQRWPGDRHRPLLGPAASLPARWGVPPQDPVTTMPVLMVGPVAAQLDTSLSWRSRGYFAAGWFWSILVWSLIGSAIARIAVLRYTWDRPLGPYGAMRFAQRRVWQHVSALLIPILVVLAVGLPVIGLALLMRISWGAALGGLLWGAVLLVSLVSGTVALGLLLGWPLIWGTLATEDSDSFDALSRTYAYAFQGLTRYVGYLVLASLVGIAGWLLVWLFSELVLSLGHFMAEVGMGQQRLGQLLAARDMTPLNGSDQFAGSAIFFWETLLRSIASGYAAAFFWTALAGIYLLLRQDVEQTPLDTVCSATATPPLSPTSEQRNA